MTLFGFRSWLALAGLLIALAAQPVISAPLPQASPESVGLSGERLAKLDEAFRAAIAAKDFPGAVILVARRGQLAHRAALGEARPGVPVTEDTIFRIYSMTKPLVSVAAMILAEDGKLLLTDRVGKFLPGFDKMSVSLERKSSTGEFTYTVAEAARAITVQDLLRHTSGLAYAEITGNPALKEGYRLAKVYRPEVPFDARGVTPSDQVAALAQVPLVFHPGSTWNYGLSTDVLGRVVEAASSQRLHDFLKARLFDPLRMTDSGFAVPAADRARIAEPFPVDRTSGQPNVLIDPAADILNDSGGAGGFSTAGDYLRFCQMLLNGGELDGKRILSRTTVRLMTSDHLGSEIAKPAEPGEGLLGVKGYTLGLGSAVRRNNGLAAVPGSAGDFTWRGYAGTYFWVDPQEQLTAVMMTQAPGPLRVHYRRLLRQMVFQAMVD